MSNTQFPSRFGKYILLDKLASGGMAEVYRAKVTGVESFQRLCAIKCMLPTLVEDPQFVTMFIDEAKIAAQLNHANIVQIYELGRLNDRLYIAMELISGRNLRDVIKRANKSNMPIPVGFAAYVVAKAAEGLDFAHRKTGVDGKPLNLVHRDVSPQNILVSYDGEVKVVDFGIAKAELRATETRAGVLKGKFAYMAPEQVVGENIDRRADIFALGSVLYEILTGAKLFTGESDFSVLEKVRNAEKPDFKSVIQTSTPELENVLARALAKNPNDRFAFASDVAEALTPLLIDNRSLFGAKQAAQFMQTLYVDEIEFLAEQNRKFMQIGEEDCIDSSTQKRQPRVSEVFETAFAKTGTANLSALGAGNESTGWTGAGTQSGVVNDDAGATQLYEQAGPPPTPMGHNPSHSGSKSVSRRVTIHPQMMEHVASAPSLVVERPQKSNRDLFVGFVIAIIVILGAVIALVIVRRPPDPVVKVIEPQIVPAPLTVTSAAATTPSQAEQNTLTTSNNPPTSRQDPKEEEVHPTKGRTKTSDGNAKYGFISVKKPSSGQAKVCIDGRDCSYAPIYKKKLKVGKHELTIIPEADNTPGKAKKLSIEVHASDTENAAAVYDADF